MDSLTPLPNGLSSMGSPVTGGAYLTTGSVYFVDSNTGLDSYDGQDPDHAFATVDHAVTHCTSGLMDTIFCMPNHAETISSSTEMRLSVDGIQVIGLGRGENRPTFTIDTAVASKCDISGHSISIKNLLFKSGIDAITAVILLSGTDGIIRNCEYMSGAAFEAVDVIYGDSCGAGGWLIDGFRNIETSDPGGTNGDHVIFFRAPRRVEIKNCHIVTYTCDGVVASCSGAGVGQMGNWVHHNYIVDAVSDQCIEWSSDTNPSVVSDNRMIVSGGNDGGGSDTKSGGVFFFQNRTVNVAGELGVDLSSVVSAS